LIEQIVFVGCCEESFSGRMNAMWRLSVYHLCSGLSTFSCALCAFCLTALHGEQGCDQFQQARFFAFISR
jgi:hypothetical protein